MKNDKEQEKVNTTVEESKVEIKEDVKAESKEEVKTETTTVTSKKNSEKKEVTSTEEVKETVENPNAKLAEPQETEELTTEEETSDISTEELETQTVVAEGGFVMDKTPHLIIIGIVLTIMIAGIVSLLVLRRKNNRRMCVSNQSEKHNLPVHKSNKTDKLMDTAKSCPVRIASIHGIGMRSAQQDSFGISEVKSEIDFDKKGVLAIVADGMGGLSDGDRVSQMTVVTMLQEFDEDTSNIPASSLLLKLVHDANVEVCDYLGESKLGKCGSTLTAVIVKDRKLSWISVGDSHIYIFRKGKLVKMNQDHNYAAELDEMVKNGEMSLEDAMTDPQRAALTSFIGMGELELVDQNENPIILEKGDRILLMSDGVYGSVSDQRIIEIMNMPLLSSCKQIESDILERNKRNQDNYTCVILEVK